MRAQEVLVSVIIPTYNRVGYLREAVASVRAQTYVTWELIVVDDGSTDETRAYLSSLPEHRLRIITRAHCGNPAILRNVGLRAARGEYIAFLDSDDVWAPGKLEAQLRDLLAHPDHRWSYSKVRFIDGNSQEIAESRFQQWRPYSGMIFEELLSHEAKIACPTVLAERRLIEEVGGFDESLRFGQDYDLWLRLSRRAAVRAVPAALTSVRSHEGSTTQRGRMESTEFFALTYRRLLRCDLSARARWRCRRQYAFYLIMLANNDFVLGRYSEAWRRMWVAFVHRPLYPRWWSVLARGVLRPIVPPFALAMYRSRRHQARATP